MEAGLSLSEAAHEAFNAYYRRREEERERRGDPTPEALGAIEARDLIEGWRQATRSLEATAT